MLMSSPVSAAPFTEDRYTWQAAAAVWSPSLIQCQFRVLWVRSRSARPISKMVMEPPTPTVLPSIWPSR